MNKDRRNRLEKAKGIIEQAQMVIEDVMTEEEMAFDNLSEGLQQTMRGETMENNIDILNDMKDLIDEVIEKFDEIE